MYKNKYVHVQNFMIIYFMYISNICIYTINWKHFVFWTFAHYQKTWITFDLDFNELVNNRNNTNFDQKKRLFVA